MMLQSLMQCSLKQCRLLVCNSVYYSSQLITSLMTGPITQAQATLGFIRHLFNPPAFQEIIDRMLLKNANPVCTQ